MAELDENIEAGSQETDWFGNLFDNLQAALKQTAFKAIAPPGADLALKAARSGVQKVVGEVSTNLVTPRGYGTQYYNNKWDQLKLTLEDDDWKTRAEESANIHNKGREFPFRKGFGLEAREGWEKIYKENEDGTYSFQSPNDLAVMFSESEITGKQFKAGLKNILHLKQGGFNMGIHSALMGKYESSINEDGSRNYYDKWDFELNKGEDSLVSKFSDWRESGSRTDRSELISHLGRVGVSQIFDPVEFKGSSPAEDHEIAENYYDQLVKMGIR